MGKIRPYNKENCTALEEFMIEVAMMLDTLPSFTDPRLDEGNKHIKERIEQLLRIEEQYNKRVQGIARIKPRAIPDP